MVVTAQTNIFTSTFILSYIIAFSATSLTSSHKTYLHSTKSKSNFQFQLTLFQNPPLPVFVIWHHFLPSHPNQKPQRHPYVHFLTPQVQFISKFHWFHLQGTYPGSADFVHPPDPHHWYLFPIEMTAVAFLPHHSLSSQVPKKFS